MFRLCVLNWTEKITESSRIIRSVLRIELMSSLFTRPAKRNKEFSNRTCVFIRPTCLTLSLNYTRSLKQLWQTIFIESVYSNIKESITENIDANHFKNSLKYLLVCNWRYVGLESFTLLSQFHLWVDSHATSMFKVFLLRLFTRLV